MSTGQPVWRHREAARFWESNAGAGPRGTPTLSDDGRVYAFGGTGILNALDADTGKAIWSRNAASDLKATVPDWGFSSSPLVIDDVVVVGVAGQLAAYDRATGMQRWMGPVHGGSYASPHLMTLGGVAQILQGSGIGVTSVALDGTLLWEHQWSGGTIVQPARMPEGDVLITVLGGTGGAGMRRIAVANTSGKWTTEERWTSNGLKPYFNDFVVHNGYAYGFDGSILAAVDLKDGARKWKGGRYGQGQLVLLPDQNLLLVLSEEGELALVSATPDQFTELARFRVLEGKTWNHPVHRRRRAAGSQRCGDGRLPSPACSSLTVYLPAMRTLIVGVAIVVLSGVAGSSQTDVVDPASMPLPNPTPRVIKNFGTLPDGRMWGSTAGVDIGPDGQLWAYDRCGTNSCAGSNVDPILKIDRQTGKVLASFRTRAVRISAWHPRRS